MRYMKSVFVVLVFGCVAMAGVSPESYSATVRPGDTVEETLTVTVPVTIPKADIIFAFDLTGSMDGVINTCKTEAQNIMDDLALVIDDPNFAVVSFMDYPKTYTREENGGYEAEYGDPVWGDYAYNLDQSLTDDTAEVASVINGLVSGSGSDTPQDYTRIFYESYADEEVGYRPGSKKILILFGDAVPHDLDLWEGTDPVGYYRNTGRDPGRDEIAGTDDDLDLQTVLAEMAANDVTLLTIYSGAGMFTSLWEYWTGLTGGDVYPLSSASDVPGAIQTLVEAEASHIDSLTLAVQTAGYEGWLTSVDPESYDDITIEDEELSFDFDIVLTVPDDATEGLHEFVIAALGDGTSYGEHAVSLDVIVNTPPDVSGAYPSVAGLWPPDHRKVTISILGVTDPDDDDVTISIDSITQDEPTNGLGDGDTAPDGGGIGESEAWLRAERSGKGNGRVYVISFTADDGQGGTASGSVKVFVLPNQKNGAQAVDDGQNYDSTSS